MTHTSPTQPLCRYCGKPIAKHTEIVHVRKEASEYDRGRYVIGVLRSKAECQRHVNGQVMSLDYSYDTDRDGERTGERSVYSFTVWDGESYKDEFFCAGSCATRFAYLMARSGRCTNTYNAAAARRKELT